MLLHGCSARLSIAFRIMILALAPATAVSAQATYHVAPCGDDLWTGLGDACSAPDGPKATIQAAIDASIDGDTIVLASGTYVGPGNADLDFHGHAIMLRSAGGDPAGCVIEPPFGSRGFVFQGGETAAAVVQGVTVRNGTGFTGGGAARIVAGSPTLIDCVFEGNSASNISGGFGGALWIQDGSPTISNCVFRNNHCGNSKVGPVGRGGGMYVLNGSPEVIGCVFVGNTATAAPSQQATGGAIHFASGSPTVTNCVFVSNSADDAGGAVYNNGNLVVTNSIVRGNAPDQLSSSFVVSVTYCNVEGGFTGQSNIDVDPLFVDAVNGNLRLLPGSPCIDAGHNWAVPGDMLDIDGNPRFADGPAAETGCGTPVVVDLGAYEFQGNPFPVKYGDLTGDGAVGIDDFLDVLATWGSCVETCCLADLDLDGEVGISDFLIVLGNWD